MGASHCLCITDLDAIKTADIITIGGIVINAFLAYWIVQTIQKDQKNARILKDHFINETKDIRNEYNLFFSELYASKTSAPLIIPWFKLMDIKVTDLMRIIKGKYKIDNDMLSPYQALLNALVTGNIDYENAFRSLQQQPIVFSDSSKSSFIRFQQKYNHLFNDLIVKINDA